MNLPLRADAFRNDPRILKAKELLLQALSEHTRKLTAISPPRSDLTLGYQELTQAFSAARGAKLFYPFLGSGFGHGSLVELVDGSVKYDMITGIGVHYFGHSDPDLVGAAFDAALRDTIMQGNLQQNIESLELAELFIQSSGLPHCFFSTSGVMANENAVKIAYQKNAPADRILAFDRCFAGRSLTFSQVTDKPPFREGLPLNLPVDYIPFFDPVHPEESTKRAVAELKKLIDRYPGAHAVMIFELVQGEAGFYPGSKMFFEPLMQICKEHHIAVFSDEVQTFARTYRLFAYQHFGLERYVDIVAVGKLTQVCATLFTDQYCPKPRLLSQTYTGSTASILACRDLLKKLINGNYYGDKGRIAAIFHRFESHFKKIEHEHRGLIRGPYGIGGMIAFTPFDGSTENTTAFVHALFDAGVLSFVAGTDPTRVRFLVPIGVITDEDIDNVCEIVKITLLKMKKHVPH